MKTYNIQITVEWQGEAENDVDAKTKALTCVKMAVRNTTNIIFVNRNVTFVNVQDAEI